MRNLAIGMLITALAGSLAGQVRDEHDWGNLKQVKEGLKVQVVKMDLKSVQGAFLGCSDDAIQVRKGKDEVTVLREDVWRVTALYEAHRAKNMAILTAVGAGAGLAVGLVVGKYLNNETGGGDLAYALGPLAGAGLGAGIGAAVPDHPTIYRAKAVRKR